MTRRAVVASSVAGRREARRQLAAHLERAIAGEGAVLLLGGDAGVGKSRLVRDLKGAAVRKGARVVEGRCSEAESSVPYGPLMDALRFRIARGEGDAVARVLGPLARLLAPHFPQLDTGALPSPRRTPERPFDPIYGVLERLCADAPLLLVLEDVHWADPTSLEMLHQLASRATPLSLLLVATYRSDELHNEHPLRRLLLTLGRERAGESMHLGPLDEAETTEMLTDILGAPPDPAFADAIWRRTEGNPFFIEELLSALAGGGNLPAESATAAALDRVRLPATVSEAVLARVTAVGPRAVEVLSVAAIAGRRVDFDLLREVLDMEEGALVAVLEQLMSHQLLREEPVGDAEHYAFPHALMQEALYQGVISRRRRMLHRQVAEGLERRSAQEGAPLDELAYHFRLGGDHERAYLYARKAGDEAVRLRAWDDATAYYERALASHEAAGGEPRRGAELLELLADIAWRQGRELPGRQYAEEALKVRRSLGDAAASAHLLRRLAAHRVQHDGDAKSAERDLRDALAVLGDAAGGAEAAAIHVDLGRLAMGRGALDRAEASLLRGLELASRGANDAEEVLALVALGETALGRGQPAAAVARLDVALAVLEEHHLAPSRSTQVHAAGIRALLLAHEYERALAWCDAAIADCRAHGLVGLDASFRATVGVIRVLTGAAEDPRDQVEAAVEELRKSGRTQLRDALSDLGLVRLIQGDPAAARFAYEESLALGARDARTGLALVLLAEGRASDAAVALDAILADSATPSILLKRRLLPWAVDAWTRIGDTRRAGELLGGDPTHVDARAGGPELSHAWALLHAAEGRSEEARAGFSRAADEWDALGARVDATRARVRLLELLAAEEHSASAAVALGRALVEDTMRYRLAREHDRVRRALRRLGVRTRPVGRAVPEPRPRTSPLTEREEAVLREVAQGRTNREIASALGIAEKTVSVHVSHILAKLDCRTRTQAARFAREP